LISEGKKIKSIIDGLFLIRKLIQCKLGNLNKLTDEINNKLQVANRELEKIFIVDGSTGISNRRYFDNFLDRLWHINMRECFPAAFIMINIDKFKEFNDIYGHIGGDHCLKVVANIIDKTVKRKSDFVARFGGEEFTVLPSNSLEASA